MNGDAAPPDWSAILAAVEDYLFPTLKLDVYERCIYYYLLRRSRLVGERKTMLALMSEAPSIAMSEITLRERIRSAATKGCIVIAERTRRGHSVEVLLPDEIESVRHAMRDVSPIAETNDNTDVFNDRTYFDVLLARQHAKCFYCLREVSKDNSALDHVVAQVDGGNNTHRNIVVACVECNSRKQGMSAEDMLRSQYRRGLLSDDEHAERTSLLADLLAGRLPLAPVQNR